MTINLSSLATAALSGPTGPAGVSITSAIVLANGNLYLTYSNNATANAGYVQGPPGSSGTSSSGYLANTIIFANSTGYLSNTANIQFFEANNNLKLANTITAANLVLTGTTAGASGSIGALQVAGGAYFGKSVYTSQGITVAAGSQITLEGGGSIDWTRWLGGTSSSGGFKPSQIGPSNIFGFYAPYVTYTNGGDTGTIPFVYFNKFPASNIQTSTAAVNYQNLATLVIDPPTWNIANTNITVSNTYSLWANGSIYSGTNIRAANTLFTGSNGIIFADGSQQLSSGSSVANTIYLTGGLNSANANIISVQALANTDYTTLTASAGTFGSSTLVPVVTLAANGRVTGITTTAVSGGGGTTSNSFSTILVSGQPNVIANTPTAPLTFVAGSNMTITTSGTGNTITFSSTGGGGGGTGAANNTYYTTVSISSGTLTIDTSNTSIGFFQVTLNSNITTLNITNTPSGVAVQFFLVTTGDGTQRTITWPSSVKWQNGISPTPSNILNKRDIYSFLSLDAGTTWLASVNGQNY